MTKKLNLTIELARYYDNTGKLKTVSIQNYLDAVNNQDKFYIAEFIYNRLYSRYLKPYSFKDKTFNKEYKNGFSIMANCCLLVETLQSFKNGWGDSGNKSGKAFEQFFRTDKNFTELQSSGADFYKNVRCGILHQGETTGGWTISRDGKALIDDKTLKIDAITFSKRLEKSLSSYKDELINEKWDSATWDNFRTKMRKIISNCEK